MTDNNPSKLRRMMLKGKEYREEYELEYFGETTTIPLRPLTDPEFTHLMEMVDSFDEDELMEEIDDIEDVENMDEDDIAEQGFEDGFTEALLYAAKLGIDHEAIGETEEGIEEILNGLIGGVSLDIGGEVMEITNNLEEAQKFRRTGASK